MSSPRHIALWATLALAGTAGFNLPAAERRSPAIDHSYRPLVENPVELSLLGRRPSAGRFDVPADRGALIETAELVSFIEFHETADPNRKHYTFRTFHHPTQLEIRGEGDVFEHYYRVSRPITGKKSSTVVDKGSVLIVDAGFLKIQWSLGRWLYFDKQLATVTAGSAADYETKIRVGKPTPTQAPP